MLCGMLPRLHEHTVLPPDNPGALTQLARALDDGQPSERARLIGPDGTQHEIPDELYVVLRDAAAALANGLAVSFGPHNTMLTTQESADLLGISRPTLVRLLTEGEIPYSMRGRHRRVLLRDIVSYQERSRSGYQEPGRAGYPEGGQPGYDAPTRASYRPTGR
jgi:excisionase family DNA binding protein